MWTIKQPSKIIFGKNSVNEYSFPGKCLVITSKGARSRGWLAYTGLDDQIVFDNVESNAIINEDIEKKYDLYEGLTSISVRNNNLFKHIMNKYLFLVIVLSIITLATLDLLLKI